MTRPITGEPGPSTDDALKQSDERYRFLTENVPVQIWTATPEGALDYVSDQTARHLGKSPDALLAEGWQHVVHPADLADAVTRWLHALKTGNTYEVEFRLKLANGQYAWHLARAVPRRARSGEIVQWFGTNTEIEAQRQQEARMRDLLGEVETQAARLAEQNELLELEVAVGSVLVRPGSLRGVLVAVAELVVKHLDLAFARIWTLDDARTTLELQASAGLYTHVDGPHGRVPVGKLKIGKIAAERQPHLTNQVIGDLRVGDQAWAAREGMVAFAGYPLLNRERLVGVIAGFARHPLSSAALTALHSLANSVAQAIEYRRAEEVIRVSEAWLSTTLASIGDGVIATDANGRVSFLNVVAEELTGWTSAEARGLPLDEIFQIVNEDTRLTVESPVAKVLREGHIVFMANHTSLIKRGGGEVAIEDSAAPIRSHGGELAGVVLVFRDATERRRTDIERVALLEQTQRAREEESVAAQRIAEASLAKDEFLATASHELRTPLNAILGWAHMLRFGQVDARGLARAVEVIERNAKAQIRLIEDILDGSRIISGKLQIDIGPVDVIAVVEAAVDTLRPAADAKQIRVVLDLDVEASRLIGDGDRLQQVVWNLVSNAIKFTPKEGEVRVVLRRSGALTELVVVDSGQGISAEFLPHVFERFRQAEGSTTRRYSGLGLGLALVRHLVEAHGGSVTVESDGEGHGALFRVLLPVRAVAHETAEPNRPSLGRAAATSEVIDAASLGGLHVLVVDDEADARELVATVLEAHGARVRTAGSVSEALARFVEEVPNVLVSDVGMPGADGYYLTRQIRGLGGDAAGVPAVALTAYSREQDRRAARQAGFQTHLSKPVEPSELVRVVKGLASFLGRATRPSERAAALEAAEAFLKLEQILATTRIEQALRFLNGRTGHRHTGIFCFDPPTLRNLHLVDAKAPEVTIGGDMLMSASYCSIVGHTEQPFATGDSESDNRLRSHPARGTVRSYCGVLLRNARGEPFGTLCHFDPEARRHQDGELQLMEAVAPLFVRALAANDEPLS